uniref:Uncharacterized protein n=1 Tax=Triticum urartu TaxID=4572 RepID=A0A8R7TH40_TRIUA
MHTYLWLPLLPPWPVIPTETRTSYAGAGSGDSLSRARDAPQVESAREGDLWNLPVKEMAQVRGGDQVAMLHEAVESEDASRCIHERRELMLEAVKSEVVFCKMA